MTSNTSAFESAAAITVETTFNLHHEDSAICDCCGRKFETAGAVLTDGRVVGIACAAREVRAVAMEEFGYLPTVAMMLKSGSGYPSRAFDPDRRAIVPVTVETEGDREWICIAGARIASRKAGSLTRWYQSEADERAELEASERAAREYLAKLEAARASRDAKRAAGVHVGEVGKRGELSAVVEFQGNIGPDFFPRWLTVLTVTDSSGRTGQAVCWGKFPTVRQGQALRLTATVKAHGEYRGGASTTLIRCKLDG